MRYSVLFTFAICLAACEAEEPVIPIDDFEAFKEGHPGMTQACLDEVEVGGLLAWRPLDHECYELQDRRIWKGLWEHGWEWTNFCPEPATSCGLGQDRGIWLVFGEGQSPENRLPDGLHQIEFEGRRTVVPGYHGHLGSYEHLIVVDRVISIKPVEGEEYGPSQ